jgi:hypothetical protein
MLEEIHGHYKMNWLAWLAHHYLTLDCGGIPVTSEIGIGNNKIIYLYFMHNMVKI